MDDFDTEMEKLLKELEDSLEKSIIDTCTPNQALTDPGRRKLEQISLKDQRKKDGLCLECGSKGDMIGLACFCKVHGKIWG